MKLSNIQPNYRNPASLRPPGMRFGHAAKPQPENTQEWFSDLFFPRKVTPCNDNACTDHEHENPALKDKNLAEKICMWFQELMGGFWKDIQIIFSVLNPKTKPPR